MSKSGHKVCQVVFYLRSSSGLTGDVHPDHPDWVHAAHLKAMGIATASTQVGQNEGERMGSDVQEHIPPKPESEDLPMPEYIAQQVCRSSTWLAHIDVHTTALLEPILAAILSEKFTDALRSHVINADDIHSLSDPPKDEAGDHNSAPISTTEYIEQEFNLSQEEAEMAGEQHQASFGGDDFWDSSPAESQGNPNNQWWHNSDGHQRGEIDTSNPFPMTENELLTLQINALFEDANSNKRKRPSEDVGGEERQVGYPGLEISQPDSPQLRELGRSAGAEGQGGPARRVPKVLVQATPSMTSSDSSALDQPESSQSSEEMWSQLQNWENLGMTEYAA
jgi:hypothetical protein